MLIKETKIFEKEEKSILVLIEGKYGVIMSGKNWIVAELDSATVGIERNTEGFSGKSYTYHANLQQALINLADRLLRERVTSAAKERVLKIQELIEIVKEKDQWIRKAIKGRASIKQA